MRLAALVAVMALSQTQDSRIPIPDATALKEAQKLIREIFKDEYSKVTPADVKSLALKLLDKEPEAKDDPKSAFTLLREARDLAASIADVEIAFRAIARMNEVFDIDAVTMKGQVLETATRRAPTPEVAKVVADACLGVVDEALALGKFDLAKSVLSKAETLSKTAKQLSLINQVRSREAEIERQSRAVAEVKAAEKILAEKLEDPAAHQVMGKYLCFSLGKWEEGLPHLVKGSDARLKALAEHELAKPENVAGQIDLGDGWFTMAESASVPAEKGALQERARYWYEQALPSLGGLQKLRIEKRLADLPRATPKIGTGPSPGRASDPRPNTGTRSKFVDLLRLINPKQDSVVGIWQSSGGSLISPAEGVHAMVEIPYIPPEEYDLKVVIERKAGMSSFDLGLVAEGKQFLVVVEGWAEVATGIDTLDGKSSNANETTVIGRFLAPSGRSTLVYSVRKSSLLLTVDGKKVIDWKGNFSRVALGGAYVPRNKNCLFLGSFVSSFAFSEISLMPVSGNGKFLR